MPRSASARCARAAASSRACAASATALRRSAAPSRCFITSPIPYQVVSASSMTPTPAAPPAHGLPSARSSAIARSRPRATAKGSSAAAAKRPVSAVDAPGAHAALGDAVEGGRRDQQPRRQQHQPQRPAIHGASVRRQRLKALLEHALVLEAEQDLRAQDQGARLVQRRLHPLVQRHRACRLTVTRCAGGTQRAPPRCSVMPQDGLVALPAMPDPLPPNRRQPTAASPAQGATCQQCRGVGSPRRVRWARPVLQIQVPARTVSRRCRYAVAARNVLPELRTWSSSARFARSPSGEGCNPWQSKRRPWPTRSMKR